MATGHHFLDKHEVFVTFRNLLRQVVHEAQVPRASIWMFDICLAHHKVLRISVSGQGIVLVLVDILDSLVQLLAHQVH